MFLRGGRLQGEENLRYWCEVDEILDISVRRVGILDVFLHQEGIPRFFGGVSWESSRYVCKRGNSRCFVEGEILDILINGEMFDILVKC